MTLEIDTYFSVNISIVLHIWTAILPTVKILLRSGGTTEKSPWCSVFRIWPINLQFVWGKISVLSVYCEAKIDFYFIFCFTKAEESLISGYKS